MTITRILCPVDFSDCSRHAADYALAIAGWYGASVTALNVLPPLAASLPAGARLSAPWVFTGDDLRQFHQELDAFVRGTGVDVPLESMVVEGSVGGEIARVASSLPADLIVMGTHGRSGFDRLVLGSVTEKMLRKAPCPLLTVPPQAPPAAAPFRRILCAVDFSPASLAALRFAESLAKEADAYLTVMHVFEPVSMFEPVAVGGPGGSPGIGDALVHAHRQLAETVSEEARTYSHVSEVVLSGKPYREILQKAGEQQSELIVVGAHGGAIGALAFGSTANHVVRQAACPVVTVRA